MPPNELAELKIQLQDLLDKGFHSSECITMGLSGLICEKET
jgi:hypothetical protein